MPSTARRRWHVLRAQAESWMVYLARDDAEEWFLYRQRVIAWAWRDEDDEPVLSPLVYQWDGNVAASDFRADNACEVGLYIGDELPEADDIAGAAAEIGEQRRRRATRRAQHA